MATPVLAPSWALQGGAAAASGLGNGVVATAPAPATQRVARGGGAGARGGGDRNTRRRTREREVPEAEMGFDDDEEEDGPPRRPRQRGGRRRRRDEDDDVLAVLNDLIKLVLSHDVQLRDLEATCHLVLKMRADVAAATFSKEATKLYSDRTRGHRPAAHGLGPPGPHAAEAFVRSLVGTAHTEAYTAEMAASMKALHDRICLREPLLVRHFRVRVLYDHSFVKVSVALGDQTALQQFRMCVLAAIPGSEPLEGSAPQGRLAQMLREWAR